jgi:hypothetical protein
MYLLILPFDCNLSAAAQSHSIALDTDQTNKEALYTHCPVLPPLSVIVAALFLVFFLRFTSLLSDFSKYDYWPLVIMNRIPIKTPQSRQLRHCRLKRSVSFYLFQLPNEKVGVVIKILFVFFVVGLAQAHNVTSSPR